MKYVDVIAGETYAYFERETEQAELTLRVKALSKNPETKMVLCQALETVGDFREGDEFGTHPYNLRPVS